MPPPERTPQDEAFAPGELSSRMAGMPLEDRPAYVAQRMVEGFGRHGSATFVEDGIRITVSRWRTVRQLEPGEIPPPDVVVASDGFIPDPAGPWLEVVAAASAGSGSFDLKDANPFRFLAPPIVARDGSEAPWVAFKEQLAEVVRRVTGQE